MLTPQSLPWIEPLDLAACIDEPYWALLYSGARTAYSGQYSYLACNLAGRIEGSDFSPLEEKMSAHGGDNASCPFGNRWFGGLGYGLRHCLERLPQDQPNWISLPALFMMRFHSIYQFDHDHNALTLWTNTPERPVPVPNIPYRGYNAPTLASFASPMDEQDYLHKVALIIDRIHAGELYQANLTRKFIGEFSQDPDYYGIFRRLCLVSPAPYSAFLRWGDAHILSSSPELFLRIDEHGHMESRPIKGTSPRFRESIHDLASRDALAGSAKDRAENLMITDLMRNDFARSCIPGSIYADRLFEVTTHATIHHMSSTIYGKKAGYSSTIEAIKGCFPPGSMTGAPKISAMSLCSELERIERGIYSGAIGWLSGDGSCELSVVIRTLIMQGRRFEFQVGGGIVADSTPEAELQETWFKARGILAALGLDEKALSALPPAATGTR